MCWERTDGLVKMWRLCETSEQNVASWWVAWVGGAEISFATEKKLSREAMNYRHNDRLPTLLGDGKHKWVGNFIKAVASQRRGVNAPSPQMKGAEWGWERNKNRSLNAPESLVNGSRFTTFKLKRRKKPSSE
jgi:hypothetical protein